MNLPREEYLASLPKKHIASVVLITDEKGKILIVKPTYKDMWEIPGGIVEKLETPLQAARREVKEEIGLNLQIGKMLVVDYRLNHEHFDSLQIIFDGGVLKQDQIDQIIIPKDELSEYKFINLEELNKHFLPQKAGRMKYAYHARINSTCYYLEEGKSV